MPKQNQNPETSPKDIAADAPKGIWDRLKDFSVKDAIIRAGSEAMKSNNTNYFEKAKIFASAFFGEMMAIFQAKDAVTAETKKAVEEGVDQTVQKMTDAAGLKNDTPDADKKFFTEVAAIAAASLDDLGECEAPARQGFDKVGKAVKNEGEPEKLSVDEIRSLAAGGLITLSKLKAKFPSVEKLTAALDRMRTLSSSSAFPIQELLSTRVLRLFKIKLPSIESKDGKFDFAAFASGAGDMFKVRKLLKSFGLSESDILGLAGKLSSIEEDAGVTGKIEVVRDFVLTHKNKLFRNTSEENIRLAFKTMKEASRSTEISSRNLAKIAFYIDDRDLGQMVGFLVGKPYTEMARAA